MNTTDTPPQQAGGKPPLGIMGWARRILAIATIVVTALILLGTLLTAGDLPGCDSDDARDSLSDRFQEAGLDMRRYDEISTVSETEDEVVCAATLTTADGETAYVDYRFYREGEDQMIEYSIRTEPAAK